MQQSLERRTSRRRWLGLACVCLVVASAAAAFSQDPGQKLILPKVEAPAERVPPLVPRPLAPAPAGALRLQDAVKADAAKARAEDKAQVDARMAEFKKKLEDSRAKAAKAEAVRAEAREVLALQLRAGVVAAGGANSSPSSGAAALNTSEELERLLEQATKVAVEKNRPDLAPPLWQRLLDEGANAFARANVKHAIPLRRAYEIYRPFSNESLKAIVSAGTESLRYYRLHSDGPARALMAREGSEREAALAEVVRRYFLTTVGDDAAFELGCRMLERGDFISADQLFDRLSVYPDTNLDHDAIAVRRAVTQARLGRTDVAIDMANSLEGELASVKPLLIEEFSKSASKDGTASASDSPDTEIPPMTAQALEPAWEYRPPWTLKGVKTSTNNQAIMSGTVNGRPMIFVRQAGGNYVQTTLDDKDIPNISLPQLASQWRTAGWRPASDPLVVGDRIYLKSESRTVCCDANTGNVLWMGRPTRFPMDDWSRQLAMVAAHGVNVSYPLPTHTAGPQPKTMTEIMLFSDRLHHAMAISGGRVYAIEGELDTVASRKKAADAGSPRRTIIGGQLNRTQPRQNELACYDAATGRFLWSAERGLALPEGAAILSRPLVAGSHLFVALGIDTQLGLAALDVATGKLAWNTILADLGRAAPMVPVGMMVDDGSIYVASGAGTLFSVDRNGGALRWAASYPRLKAATYERRIADGSSGERVQILLDENFVAREDDLLILAVCDSDHVMAFSVTDGSLRWDSPIPAPAQSGSLGYVVGLGNGRMHLANSKWLWTVATKGGRITWDLPLDGACGRGLLAGDALYMPQSATIVQLDAERGTTTSKIGVATPDSEPVGNLLRNGRQILVASAARLLALQPQGKESTKEETKPEGKEP